jgi:hypothetical protein
VENAEQYDMDDNFHLDVRNLRTAIGNPPGPGWGHETHEMVTKRCGVWISPTRKMKFR